MSKGKLYLFLSAFIYGIIPLFAMLAYKGGANGITVSFLRSFLALPLIYVMIRIDKRRIRLKKSQMISVLYLSTIGGTIPILLLYLSYYYIPIGLATTLHFVYPLVIVLATAFLYKRRISKSTLLSVIFVTIGIFMFSDVNLSISKVGITLALLSGILYSFYIMYIRISELDRLDFIVLTFYVLLFMSIEIFLFGIFTDSLVLSLSPFSWSVCTIISLFTTLGAMPLLQIGIRMEGTEMAGIISAVEPLVTMLAGAVFLGEYIGFSQIFGATLIIMGILLIHKREKQPVSH